MALAHSRPLWLQFYPRRAPVVLRQGLEDAFAFFGGAPNELLFDQMNAVIIGDAREIGGRMLENPEILRVAAHWGFRVGAWRPYRAKTKGKVERPICYVCQGSFYGRHLLNDTDRNLQALAWPGHTANVRVHGTTKGHAGPLPAR